MSRLDGRDKKLLTMKTDTSFARPGSLQKPVAAAMRAALAALVLLAACTPPSDDGPVTAAGAMAPHLASAPDGSAVLSWLEPDGADVRLRFASQNKATWTRPVTIASGRDWFVNWADFPSVVPISESLWAAHWLQKSGDNTYAYDVMMRLSDDGGRSWSEAFSPHDDGTPTEHGFVSLFPVKAGVGVVWLDGRSMPGGGAMSLRYADVGRDARLRAGQIVDRKVCDCCQTDVAVTPEGPLLVYRDRSDSEIRDIFMSRLTEGEWTEPVPVARDDWRIAGCPVNGPAIDANGENVVVAWFTAADEPTVRVARSTDGGASFADPVDIASGNTLGRVDVVLLDGGDTIVSWLRLSGEDAADIVATRVDATGRVAETRTIAPTAAARLSGFPQMITAGDDLLFAWTAGSGEDTTIRTRRLTQIP